MHRLLAACSLLQEVRGVTGGGIVVPFNAHRYPLVARTYKRPFHVAGAAPRKAVLNPKLDVKAIENAYLKSAPNLVVVDDLLDAEALAELRRWRDVSRRRASSTSRSALAARGDVIAR